MTTSSESRPPSSGFDLGEVIYTVFRHKWKIILCSLAGIAAAVSYYTLRPKEFQSQATLLVRYVLERNAMDSSEAQLNGGAAQQSDKLINAELAILNSWDLALEVADSVGVENLLDSSNGSPSRVEAAAHIMSCLEVSAPKGGNVIVILYRDKDPNIATRVLDELIKKYFKKHLDIHRSVAAFDYVSQQTDEVRSRLAAIEEQLASKKKEADIVSPLADSSATLGERISKTQAELNTAEAELAAQVERFKVLEAGVQRSMGEPTELAEEVKPAKPASAAVATPIQVRDYQSLLNHAARLRETEFEKLSRFTPESGQVKRTQAELADLERKLAAMVEQNPELAASAAKAVPGLPSGPDLLSERAGLAGMEATVTTLQAQLNKLDERAKKISNASGEIVRLERQKLLEEANYAFFASSLEKAKVDGWIKDTARMPNISIVQQPVPVGLAQEKTLKTVGGLAAGGVGLGLAVAFLIELVFRRTVKRPAEVESRLGIPLLATIPYLNGKQRARLGKAHALEQSKLLPPGTKAKDLAVIPPWHRNHFIRKDAESIRDRVILSFEVQGLTHKPKLIAVTGLSGGEGASTLAAGLAAAFSETGDGKVLLVDMNHGHPELHPFLGGKHASSLSDVLAEGPDKTVEPTSENLYLVAAGSKSGGSAGFAPKRFYNLIPNFRASDFDYIIFDMPPLTQGSSTLAISRSMDKLLVVIEDGKNKRQLMQRAVSELVHAEANVEGIFNKSRSPIPKWLA